MTDKDLILDLCNIARDKALNLNGRQQEAMLSAIEIVREHTRTPTYGMSNYPTLLYKRFLDNSETYYNALIIAKVGITNELKEETEQLSCMIEYLRALYDTLTKPRQKMSSIHDDFISYIKGEINFVQIAKEVMQDDS